MNESEIKTIENLIEFYEKDKKKYPFHDRLLMYNDNYMFLFAEVDIEDYYSILLNLKIKQIHSITKSAPKMKNLFQQAYLDNEVLFQEFLKLNMFKDYYSDEFQEIGSKIQILVQDIEEALLGNMENGQYRDFSSSVEEKFYGYLKMFFPYYNNIGVHIIKKANK